MDLITQGLLGGAIGQAIGAKKLGKKAVVWGAVAGLLPDLDVIMQFSDPINGFLYHRWITHSLLFSFIIGPIMGWGLAKYYQGQSSYDRPLRTTLKTWVSICFWALFTHPLLDIMTSYGTQFFAPFSNVRLRLDAISVIDFGYSIPLILSLIFGLRFLKKGRAPSAVKTARLTLAGTTLYLFSALLIREASLNWAKDEVLKLPVSATIVSHPTLALPFERKIILQRQDQQTCVAHWHLWKGPLTSWTCRDKAPQPLLSKVLESPKGSLFQWFTGGGLFPELIQKGVTADASQVVLRLHDIRYPPSTSPFEGLWGLEFTLDQKADSFIGNPVYFRFPWKKRLQALQRLFLFSD